MLFRSRSARPAVAEVGDAVSPHAISEDLPPTALSFAERREVVAFLRTLSAPREAIVDEAAVTCR